eukprot:SAG11_NODE_3184_length_2625_cov_10.079572_3_plen_94_part_00
MDEAAHTMDAAAARAEAVARAAVAAAAAAAAAAAQEAAAAAAQATTAPAAISCDQLRSAAGQFTPTGATAVAAAGPLNCRVGTIEDVIFWFES